MTNIRYAPLLTYNEFECRLTGVSSLENLPFSSVFKRKSCHKIQTIVNMSDDCDNISNLFINIIQSDFNGLLKLLPVRQQGLFILFGTNHKKHP